MIATGHISAKRKWVMLRLFNWKICSNDNQNQSPDAIRASEKMSDAEENEDHRPKTEQRADGNETHVIEQARATPLRR